ncbi:SDR family oxidoreductase [Croceicoccus sp. F390]|uniref:SDR family oxidoreductase n=1 Tax=Croceicoccus esteveae TaxID=3075597 RepID=A0ABU2ZHX2_9SPHN|nr:SDR family oxidoreductase [Croceicoccus sp. F390]MDT0576208.1 SDR family oxidoreductase [Croceicoccus sp. F390]
MQGRTIIMGMYKDKVVLITGSGSGIGAAAAQRFAQEGAAVLAVDLNAQSAQDVAQVIQKNGGRAKAFTADISSASDNQAMVDAAVDAFGGLDAAFLNAGSYATKQFGDHDAEMFDRMIAINLKGVFLGLQAVLPVLRHGGSAVVTGSSSGMTGLADAAAYSAAKHGVVGLVRSASQAFAARGLRVNAVCPGPVGTAILGVTEMPTLQDADTLAVPDYAGTLLPQHIAEVALFLASRRSGGINGQALLADAGFLASYPPQE